MSCTCGMKPCPASTCIIHCRSQAFMSLCQWRPRSCTSFLTRDSFILNWNTSTCQARVCVVRYSIDHISLCYLSCFLVCLLSLSWSDRCAFRVYFDIVNIAMNKVCRLRTMTTRRKSSSLFSTTPFSADLVFYRSLWNLIVLQNFITFLVNCYIFILLL